MVKQQMSRCVQSGGAALLEGLSANRSLVEMDVRETSCGDSNAHSIQLKLSENRNVHKTCAADADDDDNELEDEEEEEQDDGENDEDEEEEARFSLTL